MAGDRGGEGGRWESNDLPPFGFEPDLTIVDRFQPPSDRAFLTRVVAATLAFGGRHDLEVALRLTDDAEITELHAAFLGDPTPTDVITFPRDDNRAVDLVVSVECAQRVARETGHRLQDELALYVVHGLLHVCGYDDLEPMARRAMRVAEQDVLSTLGIDVAPVDASGDERDTPH